MLGKEFNNPYKRVMYVFLFLTASYLTLGTHLHKATFLLLTSTNISASCFIIPRTKVDAVKLVPKGNPSSGFKKKEQCLIIFLISF
jgi:hypothetical protein